MPKKSIAVLPTTKPKGKKKFDPCRKLRQMRDAILLKGSGGHIAKLATSGDERTGDCADVAARKADQDWHITLNAIEKGKLKKITAAIVRIDEGIYGICTECGEKIAQKRLEAHPDVATCVSCQSQLEENHKHRAHFPVAAYAVR